jgi:hypothetical protein
MKATWGMPVSGLIMFAPASKEQSSNEEYD